MKIYTRTGDEGTTGLYGGGRRSKGDLLFEVLGGLDELNAALGLAHVAWPNDALERMQACLFEIGGEIGSGPNSGHIASIEGEVESLESSIDAMTERLAPLRSFILPGGCEASARLHLARTIARRAERDLVRYAGEHSVRSEVFAYLNRLSDWLFVAARTANAENAVSDIVWKKKEEC